MHVFFAIVALTAMSVMNTAYAQLDAKPLIEDVGVDEHLGERVDLSLTFSDESGKTVQLGDYYQDGVPVVLVPVYYSCPNLCTAVLNGVRDLIAESDLTLGEGYRVVNVSFDPENTPDLAHAKATSYRATLDDTVGAKSEWVYLTGSEDNIRTLMDQIGFRYKWVNDQYSHSSVLVLTAPDGKITRYVYGVTFPERIVRLGLVEAAQGKVGSTVDKLLIYCFRYDPLAGKYVPVANRIMKVGALISLVIVVLISAVLWRGELFNKRRLQQDV